LFANRLNITFDVYQKKSTDLFLNIPILASSGFNSSLQNIGSVNNKGLEIGLNTFNIRKRNFQWTTNANIAFNKNTVEKLGIDGAPINVPTGYGGNPPYLLQIGLPMYSYFLVQTQGILSADDIANPKIAKLSGQTVGDAKYLDADGNGKVDANDRVLSGRPYPKYTWGFTNNFRYKNIDLSIQMYGQHGGQIYSFWLEPSIILLMDAIQHRVYGAIGGRRLTRTTTRPVEKSEKRIPSRYSLPIGCIHQISGGYRM